MKAKFLILALGFLPGLLAPQITQENYAFAQEADIPTTEQVFIRPNLVIDQDLETEKVDFGIQENAFIESPTIIEQNESEAPQKIKRMRVIVTAYSSTPDQTDSSPFITASGTYVRNGIVAANFLKFGTRVQFPKLFGNNVFVVEDRMALKNSHKIDIWFPTRQQALEFGVKIAEVIIL